MTKNNRFKKEVRAYQHLFGVPYMQALEAVSKPFVVTPEMERLVLLVREAFVSSSSGGLVLVSGLTGAGKTFLQHYLAVGLATSGLRVISQDDYDDEIFKHVAPVLKGNRVVKPVVVPHMINPLPDSVKEFKVSDVAGFLRRVSPEVVGMPELREPVEVLDLVNSLVFRDLNVLTSLHASSPGQALGRFRAYANVGAEREELVGFDGTRFTRDSVRMVVDVSRARVGNKSFLSVSPLVTTPEVFDFWESGRLNEYLVESGFVSASQKRDTVLTGL